MAWNGPSAQESGRGYAVAVATTAGLDAALDRVETQAAEEKLPYAVQVYRTDAPGSVMAGQRPTGLSWQRP